MAARNPFLAALASVASAVGAAIGASDATTAPAPSGPRVRGALGPTVRVVANSRTPYRRPGPGGTGADYARLPRRLRRAIEREVGRLERRELDQLVPPMLAGIAASGTPAGAAATLREWVDARRRTGRPAAEVRDA